MRMQACRSLQIIYKYTLDPPIKNCNYEFIISKNIGYGQKVDKQKRAVNKKTNRKANFGDWGCSINKLKKKKKKKRTEYYYKGMVQFLQSWHCIIERERKKSRDMKLIII